MSESTSEDKHGSETEQPVEDAVTTDSLPTETSPEPTVKSSSKKSTGFLAMCLALTVAATAGAGYWGWTQLIVQQNQLNELHAQQNQLNDLQAQLQNSLQVGQQLQDQTQKLNAQLSEQSSSAKNISEVLAATQERVNGLGQRVNNLTSTSREDWLLAEAEYLLRLANQRLLMERQPQGAIALMEAADHILRDMDDMNLFSVRKAVTKDLAALKLAPTIDRTGLYLTLAALSERVEQLAFVEMQPVEVVEEGPVELEAEVTATNWQARMEASLRRAIDSLGQHIAIQTHDEQPAPLLSLEHQVYVKQNLRLMFEQAQLALLREEQAVYEHSLQQASKWLAAYYDFNVQTNSLIAEVDKLAAMQVQQQLPNISASLESLQRFIADLHRLTPTAKQNPTVLSSNTASSKAPASSPATDKDAVSANDKQEAR